MNFLKNSQPVYKGFKNMNILILAKGYPPDTGGLEKYSEQIATAYSKIGAKITILTASSSNKQEEFKGIIRILNVGMGSQLVVFFRMLKRLLEIRSKETFDFIHATSWRVALPALILLNNTKIIISIHGREVFTVPLGLRILMHWVFRKADLIVAVSRPILTSFKKRLPFKLHRSLVAWNGISFEDLLKTTNSEYRTKEIFCLCRLVERKNIVRAVRACGILDRQSIDFRFLIAGSGPEAEKIDKTINIEGLSAKVQLLGRIQDEDVPKYYRRASIFLHPQISLNNGNDIEGFGISIADAMAFGAVAVAGRSGGPSDFISHQKTGILVDGTQPEKIAYELKHLLTNDEKLCRISQTGACFARESLTWNRHVKKILDRLKDNK